METNHKTFKPFDKVIYRLKYFAPTTWHCGIFSDYNKQNNHITLCNDFAFLLDKYDILPYEGNEHLVGTTDVPDEEVKLEEGEWLMVCDFPDQFDAGWNVRQFKLTQENRIYVTDRYECIYTNYNYAIRFSDFNPNDMEETKKHILCVKNGKVVKYKPE